MWWELYTCIYRWSNRKFEVWFRVVGWVCVYKWCVYKYELLFKLDGIVEGYKGLFEIFYVKKLKLKYGGDADILILSFVIVIFLLG